MNLGVAASRQSAAENAAEDGGAHSLSPSEGERVGLPAEAAALAEAGVRAVLLRFSESKSPQTDL